MILELEIFEELIEDYDAAGGVMEFYFIEYDSNDNGKRTHWDVCKYVLWNYGLINSDENEDLIKGEKLKLEVFLGPLYDFETQHPLIKGESKNHLNDYFKIGTEEILQNVINLDEWDVSNVYNKFTRGFTEAFLEPPYGMTKNKYDLFNLFSNEVFSNFKHLMVYKWDTSNLSYFDFGREWWGDYLWTVFDKESNRYIVITANSSD